jgi:hypothetical protein
MPRHTMLAMLVILLPTGSALAATDQQIMDARLDLMRLAFACGDQETYKIAYHDATKASDAMAGDVTTTRHDVITLHQGLVDGTIQPPSVDTSQCGALIQNAAATIQSMGQ